MIPLPLVLPILLASPVAEVREAPVVAPPISPVIPSPRGPSYAPPIWHALALFTVQRGVEAYLYPDPFARTDPAFWGARYKDAFTRPPLFDRTQPAFRWDHDPLVINLVGHALMGAELYHRARTCRFSVPAALAFTAAASVVWEYGFEANGVRPSAQDLVYTPVAGLVLGEARFQLFRAVGRLSPSTGRTALTLVIDPFGELERRTGIFGC